MTQDTERAAIAKQTAELVTAYCHTLDIAPADLPDLIAYVATVLSRRPAQRPTERVVVRPRLPKRMPGADVISLEHYRAAHPARAHATA